MRIPEPAAERRSAGRRRCAGMVLVEVMAVVAVIAILAGMFVGNAASAVEEARATACEKNRTLYEDMELQFQHRNGRPTTSLQELVTGGLVSRATCPRGGVLAWTDTANRTALVCSIHGAHLRMRKDTSGAIASAGSGSGSGTGTGTGGASGSGAGTGAGTGSGAGGGTGTGGGLYTDSFDKAVAAGWSQTSGKSWQVTGGRYQGGSTKSSGGGEHRSFTGDESWTDYKVDVTVGLSSGRQVGVFFRTTNASKPSGYVFQFDSSTRKFTINVVKNGTIGKAVGTATAPAGFSWGAAGRAVSIDVRGSSFAVSVDGKQVVTAKDSTYARGAIGVRVGTRTVGTFDDVRVSP